MPSYQKPQVTSLKRVSLAYESVPPVATTREREFSCRLTFSGKAKGPILCEACNSCSAVAMPNPWIFKLLISIGLIFQNNMAERRAYTFKKF